MAKTRINRAMRLVALCPLLGCTACAHMAQDNWTGRDKTAHFFSSAAFVVAGGALAEHQNASPVHSRQIGFAFSLSLGAAKEAYDSRPAGSGWSWKDFAWDGLGAMAGYGILAAGE